MSEPPLLIVIQMAEFVGTLCICQFPMSFLLSVRQQARGVDLQFGSTRSVKESLPRSSRGGVDT